MNITRPVAVATLAATALAGAVAGAAALDTASAGPAPGGLSATAVGMSDVVACRPGLEGIAETIGISTDELRDALRDHQTLAEIAEANGADPQTVVNLLVTTGAARLDAAVADGRIDEATADERAAALPELAADLVNGELERETRRHPRRARGLSAAADTIGIEVDELADGLRDGQTIAEVADANGVDPQAVIDALSARSTDRITDAVNGDLAGDRC